jgi:hypothetical protein
MRKRLRIAFAVLLLGIAEVLAWELLREKEPVYDSKPLSYWIRRPRAINMHLGEPYTVAIPALNSRAVPILIRYLGIRDGPLKRFYMTKWATLPDWIRTRLPRPMAADHVRLNSILALGQMGPAAKPAVPSLIHILNEDPSVQVRFPAVLALARIAQGDGAVRMALLGALRDRSSDVSLQAAQALIDDGLYDREEVIVALRQNLTNSTLYCREWATNLFRRNDFHGERGWQWEYKNGQQVGAANRSQPVRPKTNQPSAAADSGR